MSLKSSISDEIRRSPIATITGGAGVLVAALSLLLAWIQYRSNFSPATPLSNGINSTQGEIYLGNLLLIVGYFLAITISTAFLIRALAKKHDISALVASVPLAALTNFSTLLLIYLAPPRELSPQLFSSAHDLLFYASAAAYVAFCGMPVVRDLAAPSTPPSISDAENKKESSDALVAFFIGFILLIIWCSLVSSGQKRLTQTLLPEVTHYTEIIPPKQPT